MVYDFQTQRRIGEWGECILDRLLSPMFYLEKAPLHLQRQGIDRIATPLYPGRVLYFEYKTDFKAHLTGNAFIEITSADAGYVAQGWAITSKADLLFYFLVGDGRMFIVYVAKVKERLPQWSTQYAIGKAKNLTYFTHGLLVPLDELAQVSEFAQLKIQCNPLHSKPNLRRSAT